MDSVLKDIGINIDFYATLIGWGLVFTRIFVTLILTPFLGGRGIPGRIRLLTSVILTSYVYYFIADDMVNKMPEDQGMIIALFFKEVFFGLALGVTTIMCFYAIEAGGRIVDNQRGSANAQIFLPALGQVSIFGLFQFWVGLSFFLATSGHVVFLEAFFESFIHVPVFSMPVLEPGLSPFLELIIRMSADVLILGMQLAAPVLIAIFMTDLVLGISTKMAPQIPVFEMGFMMKGYVGVIMVYVSIGVLISQMDVYFDAMNNNVRNIVRFFGA